VVLPGHAARLPRLVLGRPGQGKSVYLAREAFLAGLAGRQAIILDGKGDSESLFRILLSDVGHRASTRKGHRPALVICDEFGALDGGREIAVDLLERGRSAGVPVVMAGQSYRSLGDEDTRDRLVSSADALVLFGSATPDELVRLAGTVLAAEAVYATEDGVWSGRASVTHRHRAKVDANSVRQLGVGEAIVISRGRAARLLVLPPPAQPLDPRPPRTASTISLPLDRLRRQVVDPARGPRPGSAGQLGRRDRDNGEGGEAIEQP